MTNIVFSTKYQLTQEIPAEIMNARLNVLDIGATDGRNGSAEDSRGGVVVAHDGGCGCSLCRQQYVADSTAGRSHQRRLQLSEVAGGPGGASSAGAAETAPAVHLQYDARRIPDEMGSRAGLSDGGAKLCRAALRVCQKNRIGTGHRSPSGSSKDLEADPQSVLRYAELRHSR